jgi:hypothetical protein
MKLQSCPLGVGKARLMFFSDKRYVGFGFRDFGVFVGLPWLGSFWCWVV